LVSVAKGLTRHLLFKGFKELEITEPNLVTGYGATLRTVPVLMSSDVCLFVQLNKPGKHFAVDGDMKQAVTF
jgi:hypothetical protein